MEVLNEDEDIRLSLPMYIDLAKRLDQQLAAHGALLNWRYAVLRHGKTCPSTVPAYGVSCTPTQRYAQKHEG
eukprot:1160745-Pelagomonas_calceolata.AAC.9